MISASTDAQQQETLIEKYMQLPNQVLAKKIRRIIGIAVQLYPVVAKISNSKHLSLSL